MLYQLVKATRRLRILLGGYKAMEEKHKLFQLPKPLTPRQITKRLIKHCYQYNALSTTYKKQIWTVRKLTDADHQIHLRFYSNGWVSGHSELQPEMWPSQHLAGRDLRSLNDEEASRLEELLR